REYCCLGPADRECLVCEGAEFSWQTLHSTCGQTDVRLHSILAVVTTGSANAERYVVKAAALSKIITNLIDLLSAPLGLDLRRGKRGQLRNRSAGNTSQTDCSYKLRTQTHVGNSANGGNLRYGIAEKRNRARQPFSRELTNDGWSVGQGCGRA